MKTQFSDINSCLKEQFLDSSITGEKAHNLVILAEQGFPVPYFYVISNNLFEKFLFTTNLSSKVKEIIALCNHHDPLSLRETNQKIVQLIDNQPTPIELIDKVHSICAAFQGPLMVRSSAVGEDSADASFAGQLDSFQTDGSPKEVLEAIKNCWASYWSERSLVYQYTKGKPLKGMGIIIQELIEPDVAGVVFTQSPTKVQDEIRIEYCYGHGERLVSGDVTPGVIKVDKKTKSIDIESYLSQDNEHTHEITLTPNSSYLLNLIEYSLKLESLFDCPLDIEWAVNNNQKLYLLQARPITTITNHQRKIYWSNVNVNENYPFPISPFLYSLAKKSYYYYFKNLATSLGIRNKVILRAEFFLNNIIGAHGARMYYNMTYIHHVIRLLPFGNSIATFFDDFVGFDNNDSKINKDKDNISSANSIVSTFLIAAHTLITLLVAPFSVRRFEKAVDSHIAGFYDHEKTIKENRIEKITQWLQEFFVIRFFKWKDAATADLSAMLSYGLLGIFLKGFYPQKEAKSKQNLLLQGIPNLVSSEPSQKIWELTQMIKNDENLADLFSSYSTPGDILDEITRNQDHEQFNQAFSAYLNEWGYRCSGELMLTEPNYIEHPQKLIELLQVYLKNNSLSPAEIIADKNDQKKVIITAIRKDIFQRNFGIFFGVFVFAFLKLLIFWTEKSISYRERVRLKQAVIYGHLRSTLLQLGSLLHEKKIISHTEHIFFFKYQELLDLLANTEMLPDSVHLILAARGKEYQSKAKMNLPDNFFQEDELDSQNFTEIQTPLKHANNSYKGISACGGIIKGKARILHSVLEAKKIEPGDILVVKQTDPGWAPVFPLISGLIIERGGMLSHGAIVAREFGIPAVVGLKNITQLITAGQEVLVNGDDGSVQF